MLQAGYSPSVRLLEAAASGVPILSDYWDGLDTFFASHREILVTRSPRIRSPFSRPCPKRSGRRTGIAPVRASSPITPPPVTFTHLSIMPAKPFTPNKEQWEPGRWKRVPYHGQGSAF